MQSCIKKFHLKKDQIILNFADVVLFQLGFNYFIFMKPSRLQFFILLFHLHIDIILNVKDIFSQSKSYWY
jgi:hypothetical protein